MTQTGADYSEARPGGAALKAAGVVGVGRYLADQGDGREIEVAEFNDLKAHGVSVWFVREGYANGILGGRAKGVSDAQVAVANLARLGLSNQVVYAAADFDIGFDKVNGLNGSQQIAAADAYMQGFASVIGASRTGIYGDMYYLNHCRSAGLAVWFWKSAASSWDHGQGGAVHLQQTTLTPPVPGSDHNYIHTANYGQAGAQPVLAGEEDMASIVAVSDWGGVKYLCVPGKYIIHISEPDPHLKAAQALTSQTGTIVSAQAQALLDECAMGNYSAQQLKDLPNTPSRMLRCTALDPAVPPISDDQVKSIADQISSQIEAGASPDQVQTIITTALAGLTLKAVSA